VTWNPERRTNGDMLESCYLNHREAKQKLDQLRQLDDELPIGDPRRMGSATAPGLYPQIDRTVSDLRHWSEQIRWWRARCVEEGDDVVVKNVVLPRKQQPEPDDISEVARRRQNDLDAGRVR
jgi:hypothetical protein